MESCSLLHARCVIVSAMQQDESFVNAQQAASYLGYDVEGDRPRALRAFYEAARRCGLRKYRLGSKLLFRKSDLNRAVGGDERELPTPAMFKATLPEQKRRA